MMYEISSESGEVFGQYEGETEADALLVMHRDAGYGPGVVWAEDGVLLFCDKSYREMLGGVENWRCEEI